MNPFFAFFLTAIVLRIRIVAAQLPTGFPPCPVKCFNATCPMQDLQCICTNVTTIGRCVGTNCSSADLAVASPFLGFCYLSTVPNFAPQTASTAASTAAVSGSNSGASNSESAHITPSSSTGGLAAHAVGNGLLAGILAVAVAIGLGFGIII